MRASVSTPSLMSRTPSVRLAAPVGRRAGVEDAHRTVAVVQRDVRVAKDHQPCGRERGAHPSQSPGRRTTIVDHRDLKSGQVDVQSRRRTPVSDVRAIIVAQDGMHRCVLR
jgi:hypothetical protein